MSELPQHNSDDAEEHQPKHVVILAPGAGLAVAAMRILEAQGLGGCVTLVEADDIAGSDHLFGHEITAPLVIDDDLRSVILKNPAAIAEPFIERERPERDWKQRERQRPKRRRR